MKIVAILFLLLISPSAHSQSCREAFGGRAFSLEASIVRIRLNAVIDHQNHLRAKRGLPELKIASSGDEYPEAVRILGETGDAGLTMTTSSFPEEPISASLQIDNSMIIRSQYNDLFSLNFVYRFAGDRLESVVPFVSWFLNQQPTEITLYRKMSTLEFALWKKRDIQNLGRDWGHSNSAAGESAVEAAGILKVVHFSTSPTFTSAAGPDTEPLIAVRFHRDDLLNWYQKKSLLWAGTLSAEDAATEIVMPVDLLIEIEKTKLLSFKKVNAVSSGENRKFD